MEDKMTVMQFAIVFAALTLPLAGALFCCLAMLERIEKHLSAAHLKTLGPLPERTEEELKLRRRELGLDDGYPFKQGRQVLLAYASTLVILYFGLQHWPC